MREPNRETQPYALRNNSPWTVAEERELARAWDNTSLRRKVNLAVRLGRTLIACKRHMTLIRKREEQQRKDLLAVVDILLRNWYAVYSRQEQEAGRGEEDACNQERDRAHHGAEPARGDQP